MGVYRNLEVFKVTLHNRTYMLTKSLSVGFNGYKKFDDKSLTPRLLENPKKDIYVIGKIPQALPQHA